MKHRFTYLVLVFSMFLTSLGLQAQTVSADGKAAAQSRKWNKFFFDLNMGGTWQTSDMKAYAGLGWGFGFGKWYLQNDKRFFDIGWRFRYLEGNTYGEDYKRTYGLQHDFSLNGSGSNPDYYKNGTGFVYRNYKMNLNEFSAELMIGANKLRERTGIMLYGWGGIGVTYHGTKTDQLDAFGSQYLYSSIDSTAPQAAVRQELDQMWDGKYETTADNAEFKWKVMPSAGIGLGYRFNRVFSMGVEFKTTWALHDNLDGSQWKEDNTLFNTADKYHYGGAFVRFTFGTRPTSTGGGGPTYPNNNPTVNNNPDPYRQPDRDPYRQPTHNTQPTEPKPEVIFTSPNNNFISTTVNTNVTALVKNVKAAKDVTVTVNGSRIYNFSYNVSTGQVGINTNLSNGNNSFVVTGTNNVGSDTESLNVIYNDPNLNKTGGGGGGRVMPGPVVTIFSPSPSPYNTGSPSVTIDATVINVAGQNEITFYVNGKLEPAFSYNVSTKNFQYVMNALNPGANSFVISASNKNGSDSKSVTVIYTAPEKAEIPPTVNITQPLQPCQTNTASCVLTATVLNVDGKQNITVKFNGTKVTGFTYDLNTKQVIYYATLMTGNNTFEVIATNTAGTDSRSVGCYYVVPKVTTGGGGRTGGGGGLGGAGGTTGGGTTGGGTTGGGRTGGGTTGGGGTTIDNPGGGGSGGGGGTGLGGGGGTGLGSRPNIAINSPAPCPYTTQSNTVNVSAGLTDVAGPGNITVKVNGNAITNFSFTNNTLTFTANLMPGANSIEISANNTYGTESRTCNVTFNSTGPNRIQQGGRQGGQ